MNRAQAKKLVTECLVDGGELAEQVTLLKHMTQVVTAVSIAELLLTARLSGKERVRLGREFPTWLREKETP